MNSNPIQSHMFLPEYLLESVVKGDPDHIDPNLFLSKATTSQLFEVIYAFHPHFHFVETASKDHDVLKRVFLDMVASRLSHIPIIDLHPKPFYFRVKLEHTIWGPQDSHTIVKTDTVLDPQRINKFNTSVLGYLRMGQYRTAAEKLVDFVQTYQYLNQDELSDLQDANEEASEAVQERVCSLEEGHQSLEGIQLLLSNSNISQKDREDLERRLQCAIAVIKSRQSMLEHAVQEVGFLQALLDHHQKLRVKNLARQPPSSQSQALHQQQQESSAASSVE